MGYLGNLRQKVAERKKFVSERKEQARKVRVAAMAEERKNLAVETEYYSDKAALRQARQAHRKVKYAPALNALKTVRKQISQKQQSPVPSKELFPSSRSADDLLGMSSSAVKVVPKKKVEKKKVYFEYR